MEVQIRQGIIIMSLNNNFIIKAKIKIDYYILFERLLPLSLGMFELIEGYLQIKALYFCFFIKSSSNFCLS